MKDIKITRKPAESPGARWEIEKFFIFEISTSFQTIQGCIAFLSTLTMPAMTKTETVYSGSRYSYSAAKWPSVIIKMI